MPTAKYWVFDEGGLRSLVNQTKANKTAAADNSAAVDGLSTDLQEMGTQITDVLGEVETCLNELDTVKADTEAVNAALNDKADASRVAALEAELAAIKEQINNLNLGFAAGEEDMLPTDSLSALNDELENLLEGGE